jgi:hypothetical protein
MAVPVFTGWVEENAVVRFDHPPLYARYLYGLEGKRVEVVIRKERKDRSLRQNSYYWGIAIQMIADHTGYEPDEVHEALKLKFLGRHDREYNLWKVTSTTKLSAEEFAAYLNRIVRWAAEFLKVYIPDPSQAEV